MNNAFDAIDMAIEEARQEWGRDGLLSLDTISTLNGMGVDVYSIEKSFEEENLDG